MSCIFFSWGVESAVEGSASAPVLEGQGHRGSGAHGRGLRDVAIIHALVVPRTSLPCLLSLFMFFGGRVMQGKGGVGQ